MLTGRTELVSGLIGNRSLRTVYAGYGIRYNGGNEIMEWEAFVTEGKDRYVCWIETDSMHEKSSDHKDWSIT